MTRLASDLFARGRRHLDGSNSDEVESHHSDEVSETGDDIDEENHVEMAEHTTDTANDSSAEKSIDVIMADNPEDSECFKHFDVLQCPPDHHYLENTAQVSSFILLCIDNA
jgi:ubiquitin-conjugating enzyme E2 O